MTTGPQRAIASLSERPAWKALREHYTKVRNIHLRQLFAEDSQRGEHFAFEAVGLYFDHSKNRITAETLRLLFDLAEQSGLRERIDAMFSGEVLAKQIIPELESANEPLLKHDSSTNALIRRYRNRKRKSR